MAFAEGPSVSRCIREAVEHHVAGRRSDPEFESRSAGGSRSAKRRTGKSGAPDRVIGGPRCVSVPVPS